MNVHIIIYRTDQGMIFIYRNKFQMKLFAVIFLMGVIVGTILLNLMMNDKGNILIEQVEHYHRLIQNSFTSDIQVFFRICLYRIGILIILITSIRIMDNYYIFYPVIFFGGISFGYTFSLLSACYGLRGVLCMGAYLFPHFLIYMPLIIGVLKETSSQMNKAYPWDFGHMVVVLLVIMAGCGAESYINPIFMKIFIKNFL